MADIQVPLDLPGGEVKFTFSFPKSVVMNKPFPETILANGPISLVSVKAKADKDFKIGDSNKSITFGVGAEGLAALGVYRKTTDLLKDLKTEGFDDAVANFKNLNIAAGDNALALRWGYGLDANAKGQVALGAGASLSFGADARRHAVSAVIHARPQAENAFESIAATLKAWRVPGQVKSVDDIPAKTTVVTETMGKLSLSLGMQYGYSYNWVKDGLSFGGLQGDLGLKIQAGISARLGFSAEGRYALALTRESSRRQLRVQVFRLRQHGWAFAFNAGVSAQLQKTPLIPKSFDDFIKGVFNLHGVQVVKDIEKWLDTDRDLADLLGEAAVEYGREMFKDITGFDPIDEAHAFAERLQGFIDTWNELPAETASLVYGWLDANTPLDDLRDFLGKVVQHANSPQNLAKEITSHVSRLDFFENPIGKWLTSAAQREVLSLLANLDDEREKLVNHAKTTLEFLNGGKLEDVLKKLQGWINEKIGLDKIEKVLGTKIDKWLEKRLSEFLGKIPAIQELDEIRRAIENIRKQWDAFYKKGYEALMQKYNFDLTYSFQNSTTREALIDLSIDFAKPDAERYLAEALDGNFERLLVEQLDGVTLNSAVLTHGIKRSSHLEIDSPFYKMGLDQINESMASAKGVDTADGRLWVFNLKAFDMKRRKKTLSKLSISAQLTARSGNVRVFDEEAYQANYKYMLAQKNASVSFVERRLELGVNEYLKPSFEAGKAFSDYLIEIDKFLDKHNVDGLGNIFATLDVSVPGKALAAFRKLPTDFSDPFYRLMSKKVQEFLREMVPLGYLYRSEQFEEERLVYPLLTYSALPLMQGTDNDNPGVRYWDFRDDKKRESVVRSAACQDKLRTILQKFRPDIPRSVAELYEDGDVDGITFKLAAPRDKNGHHTPEVVNFLNLCDLEFSIMRGVVKSARFLHKFFDAKNPEVKIAALADFGSEFTETFNEDLGGDYAGKSLRPLGSLLILELARILDGSLHNVNPVTMLETMVFKPEVPFDGEALLDGKTAAPKEAELLLHQRILNA